VVSGWMAGAVLGLAIINLPQDEWKKSSLIASNVVFRILAAIIAGLFAVTAGASLVVSFPEVSIFQAYGGVILVTLGLLHLGLSNQPFRVILGLLTVLSGFEILYAAVESSILVTGLLATVTLGLAAVGAYMLASPTLEESS
jgi:nitric oxide reductase large subunit